MNLTKALIAGAIGGVVIWLVDFVLHGLVMGKTYMDYPEVFTQEQANPLLFLGVELCIAIAAALLFAKTRASWGPGFGGGATFGFFLGLALAFQHFFAPIIYEGFPYFLAWCWAGISMIAAIILGGVLGAIYKS